jgi:hypothetical protein
MNQESPFLHRRVAVTQADNYVKYGELERTEAFGIWLRIGEEISFIAFNNIKTIRLDKRYEEGGC